MKNSKNNQANSLYNSKTKDEKGRETEVLEPALVIPVDFTGSRLASLFMDKIMSTPAPTSTNDADNRDPNQSLVVTSDTHNSFEVAQMMINILLSKKRLMLNAITAEKCEKASLTDILKAVETTNDIIKDISLQAKKNGFELNTKLPSLKEDDRERIDKLFGIGQRAS